MFNLGKRSRKNMIGLHPMIAFAVEMAIKETKQDFGIVNRGGVRTDAEQRAMYAQGRTVEGMKVTWTLDSYHQYGLAVDLVAYVNGKFTWKDKYYAEIIRAMKKVIKDHNLPIDNGFDLWKRDKPHWQLTGYKNKYDIRKIMA